jgi:rhodanese-related sulfurtransferase
VDWQEKVMNMWRYLLLVIIAGVSALTIQAQTPAAPSVDMISADELKAKLAANTAVMIIDVRSSQAYTAAAQTVKGAIHYKVRKLQSRLVYPPLKDLPKDREIVTYCSCPKDEASIAAAQILQTAGFTRVRVLQGGWQEWLKANGPVEPRAKT